MIRSSAAVLGLALSILFSAGPILAQTPFFPRGVWPDAPFDSHLEQWFGGQLRAMGEVPLWEERRKSDAETTARLLFVPTFDPAAMLRLNWTESGELQYAFKKLSGKGGYEPGRLTQSFSGIVDSDLAGKINAKLQTLNLLGGGTPSKLIDPEVVCVDGTSVMLEITSKGRYATMVRHECDMSESDALTWLVETFNAISAGEMISPDTFVVLGD